MTSPTNEMVVADAVRKRREIVRNSMRRHRAMNDRVMNDLQAQVAFLEGVYDASQAASTTLYNRDARMDRLTASTQFYLHQNALLLEALRRRSAMNESLLRMMPRLTDVPSLLYEDGFIQANLSVLKSTLLAANHVPPLPGATAEVVDGWESQAVTTTSFVKYASAKVCQNVAAPADVVWRDMWTRYCNVQVIARMGIVTSCRLVRLVDMDTAVFEVFIVDRTQGRAIPRIALFHRFQHGGGQYIGRVVMDKAAIGRGPPVYHVNLLGLHSQATTGEVLVTSKGVVSLDLVHPLYAQVVLANNVMQLQAYESNFPHD